MGQIRDGGRARTPECVLLCSPDMSSLPRLVAPLFAGWVLAACAGSTTTRGVTNMQADSPSAARATTASLPLDCQQGHQHCKGDSDCCSNLCIDQVCSPPSE